MGSRAKEIREAIRNICGKNAGGFLFFNADVKSVEDDSCTVTYNDIDIPDVRLNAAINGNANNLIIKPALGSTVLIADLSEGLLRDLAIIGWSEIDTITINGGNLGGLVKIQELTNKLNTLVQVFNSHTHPVATTGTAEAQSGTAAVTTKQATQFSKSDYEDEKIKH